MLRLLQRLRALPTPWRANRKNTLAYDPQRPYSAQRAAVHMLNRLLAGVPDSSTPSLKQLRALEATAARAITAGQDPQQLYAQLAGRPLDTHTPTYPQLRSRLYTLAPGAGYVCPHDQFVETRHVAALAGFCSSCQRWEGRP